MLALEREEVIRTKLGQNVEKATGNGRGKEIMHA